MTALFSRYLALTAIFLLIATVMLNLSSVLQAIEPENTTKNELSVSFSYLIDAKNNISFEEIQTKIGGFTTVQAQDIPYQLANQTYWINIEVNNLTKNKQNLVLYADNTLLDVFTIYQKQKDNLFKSNNVLLENKSKLFSVYPHLPFELQKNQSSNFILQIKTDGPPNVPLLIISEQDFQQRIFYTQIIYGAFIAIILLMAMYNLVLYFAVKDNVYLIYIGYLLSAFFVMSSLTGFGYLIFSPHLQSMINDYLLFIDYYLVIFLLSFTLLFLRYNQQNNKTYKVGLCFCIFLILCSLFSLTLDVISQTKLFFSLQPVVYLFALFIIIKRMRTDFSWAKFYLLSWLPLLLGGAIQPLVLLNYIDYTFLTRNAFLFAVVAEVILMAFALAERMRRNEQDRITDITYHKASGLPRKPTLDTAINHLSLQPSADFTVLIIKPEHIEKVTLYIDDSMHTELFKRLFSRLSSLFQFNDAIFSLTEKNEKICFINNNNLALIINNRLNNQSLEQLIKSIQQIVSESFQIEELRLPLSAIIGLAKYPEHGAKSHQLINHATLAISQGEIAHKKWAFFESDSSDKGSYLLKLTGDLKTALEDEMLEIYHQPQIDLKTLRVCSSECLLRWQHPQEGFIPPTIFIPIAEDMGLMNQITSWVLKKSLEQHRGLLEHGYNHMVSINISGKDIASEHFFSQAIDIIEASTIPAEKLILELTESASFSYNQHSLELIEKLSELGITISIDDFGTGYSSMSQISHFPFQELKVDREFVENVNDDFKRKIIAEATVKMAKGLGLEVVAEGINSQADEDTLREFGCDIGQGYYYAKPMALNSYIDWLENLDNGRIKRAMQGEFIPAGK